MRLYTHPKLRITVEELNGINYVKEVWRGVFNTIVFRDLVNNSLTIYEEELSKIKTDPNEKFLLFADVRELELIREEDITWLSEIVNPRYETLGFTHQAVIAPVTELASEIVDPYNSRIDNQPFVTKVFKNEGDGIKWFINSLKKE
ncbi:MAG: hypothetical protein ACI9XJ_001132 [Marivirga sp.]|jgi:hypothetical protein